MQLTGSGRWKRLQGLFAELSELPPEARSSRLAEIDDSSLRSELETLLDAHDVGGRFDAIVIGLHPTGDAAEKADAGLPAGRRIGPYAILERIARGGMGAVYLAERADGEVEYRVAIKILKRDLETDELRGRFLLERQILARINHPHIARLLDAGVTDDGRPYFVMEHVEGIPIDAYCDEHGLSVPERLELFRTVCEAVQHAHRNLVVHRDLKPTNILVTDDGNVKLLDFGIAKVLDPEAFPDRSLRTRTGMWLLTPDYASPEQLRGEPVTTASDVYQLGLILFRLLAGKLPPLDRPATRPGPTTALREVPKPSSVVAEGEPTATHGTTRDRLRRRLAGDLDNIVLLALREEPERRYPSVESLSEDVRRHLDGLPVSARPERFGYVAAKLARRHWIGLSAIGLAVFLPIAVAVVSTLQGRRVALERDRAQEVSGLLIDMFQSASPMVAMGDTITVLEVLEGGAEHVRASLQDEPELQGTMLGVIAEVYSDLGDWVRASELGEEALAQHEASLGPQDPRTIRSLLQLSDYLTGADRFDEARAYAERGVALSRAHLGPRAELTGRALLYQSAPLQRQGKLDKSRPLLEEAVTILRDIPTDSARLDLASALVNLAYMDENVGAVDSALARLSESVAIRRALLPPGHMLLVNSIGSLGDLQLRVGNVPAADSLLGEELRVDRRILPDDHPKLAGALMEYARVLEAKGDVEAAERHYRQALSILRGRGAPYRSYLAQALNDFGLLLLGRGDAAAAEPVLRESAEIFTEQRGPTDGWTAVVEGSLATAIFAQGRLREADQLFGHAISSLETVYSPMDPLLVLPLANRGVVLDGLGKREDAERVLRRALEVAHEAGDSTKVGLAEAGLGWHLVLVGETDEAVPLLSHAESALSRRVDDPFYRLVLQGQASLLEQLGRSEEAAQYRARLEAARGR